MESKEIKLKLKEKIHEEFEINKKKFALGSLINVCKYSFHGYKHFYKYERSAILHLVTALIIIAGSITLHMKPYEWIFMIFILLTMLAIELLNTAIEAICDLVSPEYNKYVKVAKDCASAATFSISTALVLAGLIIYIPKIISLLGL